jgi:hypothetical protein
MNYDKRMNSRVEQHQQGYVSRQSLSRSGDHQLDLTGSILSVGAESDIDQCFHDEAFEEPFG